MPKSKTRNKRPAPLAGIPARVLALSPAGWDPAQRASWCRYYLDGAAGRPLRREPRKGSFAPSWPVQAHRMGQRDAETARPDVAQTDERRRQAAVSHEAFERRRERETGMRSDDVLSRLSALGGGMDPHADPRIVGAALGALGLGIEALGGSLRRVSED